MYSASFGILILSVVNNTSYAGFSFNSFVFSKEKFDPFNNVHGKQVQLYIIKDLIHPKLHVFRAIIKSMHGSFPYTIIYGAINSSLSFQNFVIIS